MTGSNYKYGLFKEDVDIRIKTLFILSFIYFTLFYDATLYEAVIFPVNKLFSNLLENKILPFILFLNTLLAINLIIKLPKVLLNQFAINQLIVLYGEPQC